MQEITDESERVAEVAHNAPGILDDLDEKFEAITKLDKYDVGFLFLAAAIQCIRWHIMTQYRDVLMSKQGSEQ